MADRPILFSGPMVRALLAGTKTQTRRALKTSALAAREPQWEAKKGDDGVWRLLAATEQVSGCIVPDIRIAEGDRLWVKETWRPFSLDLSPWDLDVVYAADGERRTIHDGEFGENDWNMPKAAAHGNVTPLFMPRWASRLTLTVTEVRVERLQECTVADAVAEGALTPPYTDQFADVHALPMYRAIWTGINGPGSWEANPWVVAYSFTVEHGNIDQVKP